MKKISLKFALVLLLAIFMLAGILFLCFLKEKTQYTFQIMEKDLSLCQIQGASCNRRIHNEIYHIKPLGKSVFEITFPRVSLFQCAFLLKEGEDKFTYWINDKKIDSSDIFVCLQAPFMNISLQKFAGLDSLKMEKVCTDDFDCTQSCNYENCSVCYHGFCQEKE